MAVEVDGEVFFEMGVETGDEVCVEVEVCGKVGVGVGVELDFEVCGKVRSEVGVGLLLNHSINNISSVTR